MAKATGNWKGYVIGFLAGVLTTVVFFYFGGWDYLARGGDKIERRVRGGVEDLGDRIEDVGDGVKGKTDEIIDATFKK